MINVNEYVYVDYQFKKRLCLVLKIGMQWAISGVHYLLVTTNSLLGFHLHSCSLRIWRLIYGKDLSCKVIHVEEVNGSV